MWAALGNVILVNEQGERVAVVLDLAEYRRLIEQAEELEDLRAYDAARALGEKPIPVREARPQIEGKARPGTPAAFGLIGHRVSEQVKQSRPMRMTTAPLGAVLVVAPWRLSVPQNRRA